MIALGQIHQLEPDVGIDEQYRRRLAQSIHLGTGHLVVNETKKREALVAQVRKADIAYRVTAGVASLDRSQYPRKQNGQTKFQCGQNNTAILVDRKAKSPVASAAGKCRR